jgi:hypothetical protein
MYTSGLKKLQEKDQKFNKQELNKDWACCTFMPLINKPNKKLRSPPKGGNVVAQSNKIKKSAVEQEIVFIQTAEVGCMAGESILSSTKIAAINIQKIGRAKNERVLYARKRKSSIQIQKMARGRYQRLTYEQEKAHERSLEREKRKEKEKKETDEEQ